MDVQTNSNLTLTSVTRPTYTFQPETSICRDRLGEYPIAVYNLLTCALCYSYIYSDHNVTIDFGTLDLVVGSTDQVYPVGTRMSVDTGNSTAVSIVCGSLQKPSECWRWKRCCSNARKCCDTQINQGPRPVEEYGKTLCPRTWDGYACWPDTLAGQTPTIKCPSYIPLADTGENAYKTCTTNASWYVFPGSVKEWTDYNQCHNFEHFKKMHVTGLACNIITILLIIPACIIFLYYKPLRQQHRIRLHLCLMLSSFVASVSMLLWEVIIFRDRIETSVSGETTMHKNSVGCRMLNILTRYAGMASFMWMFIEGFHLHRLLVHAFSVPKALLPYYIVGFGLSSIPVLVYAIIRGVNDELNQRCWIEHAGGYEWILYAPILGAILVNVFFLLKIVYIMVKQLEPHPNEPSNFRRAVKAVIVLVPLFGVQFLLFVYRPGGDEDLFPVYELVNKIFSSLQGAFVAIIFCYFNKEVQGHLKTSCLRSLKVTGIRQDFNSRSFTMTTQYATDTTRVRTANGNGDSSHMIPLRPIYCPKNGEDANPKDSSSEFINGNLQAIPENAEEEFPLNPAKHD